MNNIRWIDSHCHLDFDPFINQIPEVLKSMTEHQVSHALCIGVNLEDFPRVLSVAEQSEHFWATVGVHPDYENVQEPTVQQLCDLSQHYKVIGIGETGLDYYRLKKAEVQWQRDRFKTHILAAKEVQKPLIVHTREAAADTLSLIHI
jgi:TatD DNase family protein